MDYVSIYIAGVVSGLFFAAVLLCLILAHRPTPPTMHGRRKLVQWEPPAPVVEKDHGGIRYEFLGQTGEEQA